MTNTATTNSTSGNKSKTKGNKKDRGADILIALLNGPASLNTLGVSRFRMKAMLEDGAVKEHSDTEKNVIDTDAESGEPIFGRGRPAKMYALTSKGRSRAKRRVANETVTKNTKAEAATEQTEQVEEPAAA